MLVIIGLGNPGERYRQTRHNLGFMVCDKLAEKLAIKFSRKTKLFADVAKFEGSYLVKPTTFINLSGKCVKALLTNYSFTLNQLCVIHDDADLPLGNLKVKRGGNSAGHHGVDSIAESIGSDFWRMRIGISHPRRQGLEESLTDFVLTAFSAAEKDPLDQVIDQAVVFLIKFLQDQEISPSQINANCQK